MKIITKKKALKFVGLQIAIITALVLTQMAMVFFAQNKLLVVQSKKDGWYGIAQVAQADKWTCQQELDQLHASIQKQNEDGIKDLK